MIDIHSHIIYDVDDGSKSIEQSIEYLNQIKKIGMNNVVCTPHVHHLNKERLKKIKTNFNNLKKEADKLDINLYLANEIMYSSNIIELLSNKDVLTINETKYILVEFKRYENMDKNQIYQIFQDIIDNGYIPILAHPELYRNYRDINFVKKLKDMGVIIQIDATSILLSEDYEIYRYAYKLLNNYLVDVVASDSHCTKKRGFTSLLKAYKKIKRKYGSYADIIFDENPKTILGIKST